MRPAQRFAISVVFASIAGGVSVSSMGCARAPSHATLPKAGPGEYAFWYVPPVAGQTIAVAQTTEQSHQTKDGTGAIQTRSSRLDVACQQTVVATSGDAVVKTNVECQTPGTVGQSGADAGRPGFLRGVWTAQDGVGVESTNLDWEQANVVRPVASALHETALHAMFGGLWRVGAVRTLEPAAFWQLVAPDLAGSFAGGDAPATLSFAGLAEGRANFTYAATIHHDDVAIDIKGEVAVDTQTGWPTRAALTASSSQDMAEVRASVVKTITIAK